jgi:hypothetical protein
MVSAGGKQGNDKGAVKDDGREHDIAIAAVDTTVSEAGALGVVDLVYVALMCSSSPSCFI